MSRCECCGSRIRVYPCRDTMALPLEPVQFETDPFSPRSKRAKAFRAKACRSFDSAKWIAELSEYSAHAVQMVESAPMIYALISHVNGDEAADKLERARDVRAFLKRYEWPSSFIRLSYGAAVALRPHKTKLVSVPPDILSQSIPAERQAEWALNVSALIQRGPKLPLVYYLRRANDLISVFREVSHFRDFYQALEKPFDQTWGTPRLQRELVEWERTFALRKLAEDKRRIEIIEGCPERLEFKGFEFIALNSRSALEAEGNAMRHCVGGSNYARRVELKKCVIYAVQNGTERGTLQIVPGREGLEVNQLKGPRNGLVSAEMTASSKAFCKLVSEKAAQRLAP
jgi:hypothetical protein